MPISFSLESFTDGAIKLLLGEESLAVLQKRAFGVQTLSGTGALRYGRINLIVSFVAIQRIVS